MDEAVGSKQCVLSGSALWAYQLLRIGFAATPIITGVDKFFNIITRWDMYLAPALTRLMPVSPAMFMRITGCLEIVAGLIVAVKPRIGGIIVAAWLFLIIVNLIIAQGVYDIALRDLGLLIGAVSLSLLGNPKGAA